MLNNRLREVREDIGMSISELARRSKTSRQTITGIELHGREPSGSVLIRISNALNKDPRHIFFTNNVQHVEQKSSSTSKEVS